MRIVNEGVHPHGEHVPQGHQVPQGEQVPISNQRNKVPVVCSYITNKEVRGALVSLARAMTAQVNRDVGTRMNALKSTIASRLRGFCEDESFYLALRDDNNVRYSLTMEAMEREANKVLSEGTGPIPPNQGNLYCLQANREANQD
ncbi:hypothetical protein EJD97_005314 [Solanum chilense]|uniref:Uncharacterized protein n=1 Tax=Solanum chilense TaxID=4083 RepID=A0A6N2CAL4_SOLCI|nr:hypothetical protein EJD97_005314 [Solanum chilense]